MVAINTHLKYTYKATKHTHTVGLYSSRHCCIQRTVRNAPDGQHNDIVTRDRMSLATSRIDGAVRYSARVHIPEIEDASGTTQCAW